MWRVMDAVNAEAVVQGQAGRSGGEQSQLQTLTCGMWRARLANQSICPQLLHENMTTLLLELQIARRRQGLLTHRQHLLQPQQSR